MAERNNIGLLLSHKVSWLDDSGPLADIAISSRIRLARNLEGMAFPIAAAPEEKKRIKDAIETAILKSRSLDKEPLAFDMCDLNPFDKQILLERRLVSNDFISEENNCGTVFVKPDESAGIMINEEDHLRIQSLAPGFQLEEVWKSINSLDNKLSRYLPYAFDSDLGFLTSCPTNVGTGMRASVMLHLPGLVLSGQINAAIQGISKLGLAVRGLFGEGSDNRGNLFQVSNQSTLGESEEQIIDRLVKVIRQLINHEKNSRLSLLETKRYFLLNHVGRAYGTLRHAYILSSEEALNSLSALRIGVDLGMFSTVDLHTVNELFLTTHPAHLQRFAGKHLDSAERDVFRARLVREKLMTVDKK